MIYIPVFVPEDEVPTDFETALDQCILDFGWDHEFRWLEEFQPFPIVPTITFGKPTTEMLNDKNLVLCPGPSVAQVLGTPHGLERMRRALRLWKMMVEGNLEDPFYQYDLVEPQPDRQGTSLMEYRKRFAYFQAECRKLEFIVVDIETSGDIREDEPEDTELISVAVLFPKLRGKEYQIAVWTTEALDDPYCRTRLAMILTSGVPLVWYNGQFDSKWVNNRLKEELQGQVVKPQGDTLLMHYAQFPGATGDHRLKPLCQRLLGAPEWEKGLEKYTVGGAHYERVPGNMLYAYNAGDVYWTWKLRELLLQWLNEGPEGPRRVYYDLLIPATQMLVDIESTDAGWPVDLELLHTQQKIHGDKAAKQLAKFRMAVGDPTPFLSAANATQRAAWLAKGTPLRDKDHQFNPKSPAQIQKYLRSLNIDTPSTDEEHLTELLESGELPRKPEKFIHRLLDYRHTTKMDSGYITGVLKKQRNGLVRPRFNLAGTVTGRLSSWVHTVPRPEGEDAIYRSVFIAGEGMRLIGVDFGQIETRIVAELAGDPQMIDDLQEGRPDFFSVLMPGCFPRMFRSLKDVWELKESDPGHYKALRNQVKPISHGANYMRQPPAMAKQLGIPLKDAYTMYNAYMERYSMLRPWQEETMSYVRGDLIDPQWGVPGLWTPFGRRFQQGVITDKNGWSIKNAAIAFKPQSAGSDVCLTAAISLHEKLHLYQARLVNSQHDALYVIAPEDYAEPVLKLMQREMRASAAKVFKRVPFITEGHIGRHWAEA